MFVHVFNQEVFDTLVERGLIPLKQDYPYIGMIDEDTYVDFDGISKNSYEFSDIMYFS